MNTLPNILLKQIFGYLFEINFSYKYKLSLGTINRFLFEMVSQRIDSFKIDKILTVEKAQEILVHLNSPFCMLKTIRKLKLAPNVKPLSFDEELKALALLPLSNVTDLDSIILFSGDNPIQRFLPKLCHLSVSGQNISMHIVNTTKIAIKSLVFDCVEINEDSLVELLVFIEPTIESLQITPRRSTETPQRLQSLIYTYAKNRLTHLHTCYSWFKDFRALVTQMDSLTSLNLLGYCGKIYPSEKLFEFLRNNNTLTELRTIILVDSTFIELQAVLNQKPNITSFHTHATRNLNFQFKPFQFIKKLHMVAHYQVITKTLEVSCETGITELNLSGSTFLGEDLCNFIFTCNTLEYLTIPFKNDINLGIDIGLSQSLKHLVLEVDLDDDSIKLLKSFCKHFSESKSLETVSIKVLNNFIIHQFDLKGYRLSIGLVNKKLFEMVSQKADSLKICHPTFIDKDYVIEILNHLKNPYCPIKTIRKLHLRPHHSDLPNDVIYKLLSMLPLENVLELDMNCIFSPDYPLDKLFPNLDKLNLITINKESITWMSKIDLKYPVKKLSITCLYVKEDTFIPLLKAVEDTIESLEIVSISRRSPDFRNLKEMLNTYATNRISSLSIIPWTLDILYNQNLSLTRLNLGRGQHQGCYYFATNEFVQFMEQNNSITTLVVMATDDIFTKLQKVLSQKENLTDLNLSFIDILSTQHCPFYTMNNVIRLSLFGPIPMITSFCQSNTNPIELTIVNRYSNIKPITIFELESLSNYILTNNTVRVFETTLQYPLNVKEGSFDTFAKTLSKSSSITEIVVYLNIEAHINKKLVTYFFKKLSQVPNLERIVIKAMNEEDRFRHKKILLQIQPPYPFKLECTLNYFTFYYERLPEKSPQSLLTKFKNLIKYILALGLTNKYIFEIVSQKCNSLRITEDEFPMPYATIYLKHLNSRYCAIKNIKRLEYHPLQCPLTSSIVEEFSILPVNNVTHLEITNHFRDYSTSLVFHNVKHLLIRGNLNRDLIRDFKCYTIHTLIIQCENIQQQMIYAVLKGVESTIENLSITPLSKRRLDMETGEFSLHNLMRTYATNRLIHLHVCYTWFWDIQVLYNQTSLRSLNLLGDAKGIPYYPKKDFMDFLKSNNTLTSLKIEITFEGHYHQLEEIICEKENLTDLHLRYIPYDLEVFRPDPKQLHQITRLYLQGPVVMLDHFYKNNIYNSKIEHLSLRYDLVYPSNIFRSQLAQEYLQFNNSVKVLDIIIHLDPKTDKQYIRTLGKLISANTSINQLLVTLDISNEAKLNSIELAKLFFSLVSQSMSLQVIVITEKHYVRYSYKTQKSMGPPLPFKLVKSDTHSFTYDRYGCNLESPIIARSTNIFQQKNMSSQEISILPNIVIKEIIKYVVNSQYSSYKYILSLGLVSKSVFGMLSTLIDSIKLPSGFKSDLANEINSHLNDSYCLMKTFRKIQICPNIKQSEFYQSLKSLPINLVEELESLNYFSEDFTLNENFSNLQILRISGPIETIFSKDCTSFSIHTLILDNVNINQKELEILLSIVEETIENLHIMGINNIAYTMDDYEIPIMKTYAKNKLKNLHACSSWFRDIQVLYNQNESLTTLILLGFASPYYPKEDFMQFLETNHNLTSLNLQVNTVETLKRLLEIVNTKPNLTELFLGYAISNYLLNTVQDAIYFPTLYHVQQLSLKCPLSILGQFFLNNQNAPLSRLHVSVNSSDGNFLHLPSFYNFLTENKTLVTLDISISFHIPGIDKQVLGQVAHAIGTHPHINHLIIFFVMQSQVHVNLAKYFTQQLSMCDNIEGIKIINYYLPDIYTFKDSLLTSPPLPFKMSKKKYASLYYDRNGNIDPNYTPKPTFMSMLKTFFFGK
ncbi:hypothetical protein DLAC_00560 [Tieghemostelium lacteum]|uniref:Uncharacterized protein n=1 Tax=Tieghemostelium lacteum TaxID=361077 RepID=A0A152AA18_TIELA|nr:hypothetical protein DLAC_00560 [Tieghemostelium lacteum]|eukprot:KYR03068.1 hypothetical protein DLAC_00560 [Tieghemostelium lacteum]